MEDVERALVCRDRCLQAMGLSTDMEERRSLWRAASKFARKAREDAAVAQQWMPATARAWPDLGGLFEPLRDGEMG